MKPPATKHVKSVLQPPARQQQDGDVPAKWECLPFPTPTLFWALWLKLRILLSTVTVEPVMFLDGISFACMIVFVENLQMDKICQVNLNFTLEVCDNISNYPEQSLQVQQAFSVFGMYNGIIMSFLPLFFILFMGAWSDKYGRKVPIVIATVGHLFWTLGYLVNSMATSWPVEYILLAALCDSLGGGNVSFITAANAYLSDVTSEESRTARVGFANSMWFLGGPIGTLLGTYIYKYGGYQVLFSCSAAMHIVSLILLAFLPESHGPFAKKKVLEEKNASGDTELEEYKPPVITLKKPSEITDPTKEISLWKMFKDFFNYGRIVDSFRCTFKPREGLVRVFIILLILCALLRRLGRGAYMYLFTRRVLGWKATDYGIWVTYKNFISSLGPLVMVPLLSTVLEVSDNYLAMIGSFVSILDYILYGLVSKENYFLVWLAPAVALLVNACSIAIRSMLSKFVMGDELGKVSAVMGALDGVMPMVSFSLYTYVYHATVHTFPGAQFFFGAGANVIMTIIFIIIIVFTSSKSYGLEDLNVPEGTKAVRPTALRIYNEDFCPKIQEVPETGSGNAGTLRTTAILSSVNFHLGTPGQKKRWDTSQGNLTQGYRGMSTIPTVLPGGKNPLAHQQIQSLRNNKSETTPSSQGDAKTGVDNPAFISTEEEPSALTDSGHLEVILSIKNLAGEDYVPKATSK